MPQFGVIKVSLTKNNKSVISLKVHERTTIKPEEWPIVVLPRIRLGLTNTETGNFRRYISSAAGGSKLDLESTWCSSQCSFMVPL